MIKARGKVLQSVFGVTHAYDDMEGLFAIAPDRLGFGVIAAPLTGADQQIQDKINLLLNLPYPTGTIVQFSLYASPDIDRFIERYEALRAGVRAPVLREIAELRVDFLRGGTTTPVDSISGIRLHNVVLLITVSLPGGKDNAGLAELGVRDEALRIRAAELKLSFEQTVKAIGFDFAPLTADVYLRVMRTLLNHGPEATWRSESDYYYDDEKIIAHQILDADVAIDVDAKGLWLGDYARVHTLSPKAMPANVYFGQAMKYIGDYISGQRGIREPVLITANLYYPDHESLRGRMETDHAWATRQASGPLARYVSSLGKRKESLDIAVRAVEDGDRFVQCYLGMALFCENEDHAIAATANARAYWREMGFQMMQDHYITLPLFAQMLPFAAEADIRASLMRYKTYPTRSVVPLLPVMGAWRGTGTPLVTLFARDGQVMGIDPFDSETNYNACVAAASGSGKSFFINEMVANFRSAGGRVSVIDVGFSYKPLCEVLEGQYVQFGRESRLCINPFSMVQDFDDESDVLAGILTIMAAPNQGLDDFQIQGMKRVLAVCYHQHRRALTVDLIISALMEESDQRLRDVGQQLYSFSSRGEYGRYFNGENNVDLNNPFVVLELEELKQQRHLQKVVLLMLLYQIQQQMFMGDRSVRKLMVIDEAWDLLGSEETRGFVIAMYRRVRKAGGSIITITQSVSDYWMNPGTVAIVENSANKYLLRQTGESISMVQKENRLQLGDWGYQTLRSVHTVQGEYSEIMCITDRGVGVGRLVVSDFNKLLYSTRPDDVSAIKRHRDLGADVVKAIHAVMRERRR